MKELLLIRHGQTDWNAEEKVMGRLPIPLNQKGQNQAHEMSNYLKNAKIDVIVTSPVLRAKQTAEIIAINHPKAIWIEADELAEADFGPWIGKSFSELKNDPNSGWETYFTNPEKLKDLGIEDFVNVRERISRLIERIKREMVGKRVAFVTHADLVKMGILHALDLPLSKLHSFSIDNLAVVILRSHYLKGLRMIAYNYHNGFGGDM